MSCPSRKASHSKIKRARRRKKEDAADLIIFYPRLSKTHPPLPLPLPNHTPPPPHCLPKAITAVIISQLYVLLQGTRILEEQSLETLL